MVRGSLCLAIAGQPETWRGEQAVLSESLEVVSKYICTPPFCGGLTGTQREQMPPFPCLEFPPFPRKGDGAAGPVRSRVNRGSHLSLPLTSEGSRYFPLAPTIPKAKCRCQELWSPLGDLTQPLREHASCPVRSRACCQQWQGSLHLLLAFVLENP